MGLGLIMELSVFSIMKEDNLVIGVSSVDTSTMNLGVIIWILVATYEHFRVGEFLLIFCGGGRKWVH